MFVHCGSWLVGADGGVKLSGIISGGVSSWMSCVIDWDDCDVLLIVLYCVVGGGRDIVVNCILLLFCVCCGW